MKFREVGTIIFVIVVAAAAGYAIIQKVKPNLIRDDNFIEELIEIKLEKYLGLEPGSIDLTPNSPEKR